NAEAIADMALENFIEMRDSVGNPEFLFRKEVEHRLERHFPDYVSRYELVSFSRIPYAEAYQRGLINQQILDELLEGIDSVEEVDMEKAGRLIEEKLSKFN
ncbi:MAG: kynurenine 3-monooxygenase, partial [Bacteroidota bacterium]